MDAQGSSKRKIGWKTIIAALLVLGIFGFFLTTSFGQSLFGSFLGSIFGSLGINVGNLGSGLGGLNGLTGFISQPKPSGPGFQMTLAASQENFYGQSYQVTNASVDVSGIYNYLDVGSQSFNSKSGQQLQLVIQGFSGSIQFTNSSTIVLSGSSSYMEIGDLVSSSNSPVKIQAEILPGSVTVDGLNQNSIHFDSVTGSLSRYNGNATDNVALTGGKLDISFFDGSLSLANGIVTLSGIADSAKGANFSFV